MNVLLIVVVVEWGVSSDRQVRLRVVTLRCYTSPQDDAVGVWITGGHAMSEVQGCWVVAGLWFIPLNNSVYGDAERWVMFRW